MEKKKKIYTITIIIFLCLVFQYLNVSLIFNLKLLPFNEISFLNKSGRPTNLWNEAWSGGEVKDLVVDFNEDIIIVGTYSNDVFVCKFDSEGDIIWGSPSSPITWGGSGIDGVTGVDVDSNNNIYVCGYTHSFGAGNADAFIFKMDSGGNIIWGGSGSPITWGYSGNDQAQSLVIDNNGDIVVTGYTDHFDGGEYDLIIIKFDDSDGSVIWGGTSSAVYWGTSDAEDMGYEIVVDSNNNYCIVGWSHGLYENSRNEMILLKYSQSGSLVWGPKYWGTSGENESGWGITVDSSNNIYIVGTRYTPTNRNDAFLMKYNTAGNVVWGPIMWGTTGNNEAGLSIKVYKDSILYVAGTYYETDHSNVYVSSYNLDGNLCWGESSNPVYLTGDVGYKVNLDTDSEGNIYIGASYGSYELGKFESEFIFNAPNLTPLPTQDSDGIINLDWDDLYLADNYSVYRDTNTITDVEGLTPIAITFDSEYQDNVFIEDTYYYVVVAKNESTTSPISNCVFTTLDFPIPMISINNVNYTTYLVAPQIDVDFSTNLTLDSAYYKVDSYNPMGMVTTGWTPIFSSIANDSYTHNFMLDSTIWDSLDDGSRIVYFKAWDNNSQINDGSSPAWQFYKDTSSPIITINTPNGNYFATPPLMDVDFSDVVSLDDAYYKVDSYSPTGLDTTGWTSIFTDHSGTSNMTDFIMDSSVWNGLSEGSHTVYFKAWDDSGYINDGSSPSWQFYKDTSSPIITINTLNGNYFASPPLMDVDFSDLSGLDDAYYKVDSYTPTGFDTTGWTPIFTDHSGTSNTTDFAMDSTVWNGLSEGSHIVYYKAWDDLGNINDGSSPSWQFYKDTGIPSIFINNPNGNYYASVPLMDIDFSDIGGLDDAYYKVDSYSPTGLDTTGWTPIFTDHSGTSYSTNFAMDSSVWNGLSEGSHTVYFKAWDDSGYINDGSSPSWQFYKDTSSPIITINIPNGNYFASAPLMDVNFLDNYGLDDAYYKVDSYTPTGLDTTGWTPIFTSHSGTSYTTNFAMDSSVWNGLSEGSHTVYFKAWDDSGYINDGSSPSWQFSKDTEAPSIFVNNPNGNYYASAPLMDVDFSDIGGLDDAYYKVDFYTPTGLDTTGWIQIFTDHSGTSYTTDFAMDNSVWNGLSEGSHTVYFKTWDDSVNLNDGSSPSWQFSKDTGIPSITVNSPNGNYYASAPLMDVDFSDLSGLDDAYYKVDSYNPTGFDTTGWIPIFTSHSGTSYSTDFAMDSSVWNGLSDGSHTIYFKVWDDTSQINDGETPIWQFFKDTSSPIITINTLNGSYFDSSPLMDVDFSDVVGLDDAYYKIDSYNPTGFDTTGWIPIFTSHSETSYTTDFAMDSSVWNGLSDGSHTIYFKAWDDLGIINDDSIPSWQFFKVSDPLTISISIPDGNYYNSAPLMDVDFSDALGLDNAYYKVDFYSPTGFDTTGWTPIFTDHSGTSYTTDFTMDSSVWNGLSDGNHTVYFKAWDDEGIVKDGVSLSWQFYKDTIIPLIILKSPGDNSVRKSGTQIILEITDSNGLNNILYKWDSAASNSTYSPLSPPTIPTGDGLHLLYIFAYDNAGNFGNKTFFFICDDTNPTAEFEGIDDGMVIDETITITVSASDENGISHIIFYINEYQTANQSNNNVFSLNTKGYIDGDYIFRFRVYDLAGNYFEQQFSVKIKNKDTPPVIPSYHLGLMLGISLISIVIFTLKKYKEQQRKGVNKISFD